MDNHNRLDDYDLVEAVNCYCDNVNSDDIESIVLTITGENDGADWHWIVKMFDGSYAYITGGCDYTGWD